MNKHRVVSTVLLALVVAACSSSSRKDDENVGATAQAITKSVTATPLSSVSGKYSGCSQRTAAQRWSLRLGGVAPLPNPLLTVVKNDSACVVTVDQIDSDSASYNILDPSPYGIGSAYSPQGRGFSSAPPEVNLYANVKIDDVLFDQNFVMTVLYSSDVNDTTSTVGANYQVVSATAVAERVPAPDYTIDASGIVVNEDAFHNIDNVSGNLLVVTHLQTGEDIAIQNGAIAGGTWADVNDAYNAGQLPTPPLDFGYFPMSASIAAADLFDGNVGGPLPLVRTIIIRHTENDVPSYQTFTITFTQ